MIYFMIIYQLFYDSIIWNIQDKMSDPTVESSVCSIDIEIDKNRFVHLLSVDRYMLTNTLVD